MNLAKSGVEQFARIAPPNTSFPLYLEKGAEGILEPLTLEEQETVNDLVRQCGGYRTFKIKQCYYNSQRIISNHYAHTLRYHEGFIADNVITFGLHHAWLSINGKVVDLTRKAVGRLNGKEPSWEYFGIEIPRLLVIKHCLFYEAHSPVTEGKFAPVAFGLETL